ncbi:TIGR02611 family protein [Jatrophihabitans sp.]|uniref:TIGR02611 family protein n=1 Tax=Jatrophihabitans sp. TaxID=1932789 RepID=UPI002F12379F
MADKPAGGTRLDDHKPAEHFEPRPPRWLRPVRDRVRCVPGGAMIWKLLIGTIGGVIVVIGLLLIPLPGPGWALVFVGLAVWATEFHWAYRLLRYGRRLLRQWTDWAKRQSLLVRLLLGLLGLLVLAGFAYVGWQTLR